MNIFLPSLPNMTAYFNTDYRIMQLSVAIYLAANAILQIFLGPLSDKFGRRPLILFGIAGFLLATLGCLLTTNIYIFLTFRMCQAVIVTAMVLSRAVVRDIVPQDQAASIIGYVTMGVAVAPLLGPVLGGVLDDLFGWQSNFILLFVMGVILFIICWRDLGETAVISDLSLIDQFREYPELLRSPRFWGYSLTCAFSSGAFFAYLGGAPFVGTEVFHLAPATLGLYFGAPALGYIMGNFLSGRYSARYGIDKMSLWGCSTTTFGLVLSILVFAMGHGSAETFFAFMTFVGLGNGLTIPNTTSGALSVRPHLAGTAAGLSGAIMIGGGAALSAFAGALLKPGSGAIPLLILMFATAAGGIITIKLVIRRNQRLAGLDAT